MLTSEEIANMFGALGQEDKEESIHYNPDETLSQREIDIVKSTVQIVLNKASEINNRDQMSIWKAGYNAALDDVGKISSMLKK